MLIQHRHRLTLIKLKKYCVCVLYANLISQMATHDDDDDDHHHADEASSLLPLKLNRHNGLCMKLAVIHMRVVVASANSK